MVMRRGSVTTPTGDGDGGSFEELMSGALTGLLRFGYVLTGDRHRAEELVQAALVATYRRWDRRRPDAPHAYVRQAMVNTHTSLWRRTRREAPLPPDHDARSLIGDPTAYDEADALVRAMRVLPNRQRAVIALRYYDDLTEVETARILGCSVGAVKSHASRALRALRAEIERTAAMEGTLR
jgi:RNA polymerase sigma-70 factor (sigma-E family)